MSTAEIRAYANAQMPDIDGEIAHLVAFSDRLSKTQVTAPELSRLLDEMEAVIGVLQGVYDRCCTRFPDAEGDPYLARLQETISGWHTIWEGWETVGRAAISVVEQ